MDHRQRAEISRRHVRERINPSRSARVVPEYVCQADGEAWPCDVTRLLEVATAAGHWAATWGEDNAVFASLHDRWEITLHREEAEAAARLCSLVGEESTALRILSDHVPHEDQADASGL
jgi:hypothetical protein